MKARRLEIVRREDEAVIRHDLPALAALFLPDDAGARQALAHARGRAAFLAAWSKARGVRFTSVKVDLRTPAMRFTPQGRVRVSAVVSEAFTYRYEEPGVGAPRQDGRAATFGVGVRHFDVLARDGGRRRPLRRQVLRGRAGLRQRGRYNPHYADYNGEGGDRTKFVSQVLRAGGFRESSRWPYDHRRGEGNRAWSNAGALYDHLLAAGRAELLAAGDFTSLTRPAPGAPRGRADLLRPGDLVAYEEGGVSFASPSSWIGIPPGTCW